MEERAIKPTISSCKTYLTSDLYNQRNSEVNANADHQNQHTNHPVFRQSKVHVK